MSKKNFIPADKISIENCKEFSRETNEQPLISDGQKSKDFSLVKPIISPPKMIPNIHSQSFSNESNPSSKNISQNKN